MGWDKSLLMFSVASEFKGRQLIQKRIEPGWRMLLGSAPAVSYSRKAWEPVSSRDSSRERRWTPPMAMLASVRKVWRGAGEGRGGAGRIFGLAGEPRPQLQNGDS